MNGYRLIFLDGSARKTTDDIFCYRATQQIKKKDVKPVAQPHLPAILQLLHNSYQQQPSNNSRSVVKFSDALNGAWPRQRISKENQVGAQRNRPSPPQGAKALFALGTGMPATQNIDAKASRYGPGHWRKLFSDRTTGGRHDV